MKKLAILSAIALAMIATVPAHATEKTSVVIIDSGFDTSKVQPIAEVCILVVQRCNNGLSFDESVGASNTSSRMSVNGQREWNHGTVMADIVRQINPNVNLIFIRNAFVVPSGAVNIGGIKEFNLSLEWVIANKEKYNISAVSFSRGQSTWTRTSSTCPVDLITQNQIISLQNIGVATAIAAGNDRNKTNISYPACISEAVAISGIYSSRYTPKIFSTYRQTFGTNSGPATDFFVYGNFNTVAGKVAESTSASTAAFAGYWSKVSNGNYFETYSKISSIMTSQKFIDVLN